MLILNLRLFRTSVLWFFLNFIVVVFDVKAGPLSTYFQNINHYDEYDDADILSEDEEYSDSSDENNYDWKYGVSFGIGSSSFRQRVGMSVLYNYTQDFVWVFNVGTGKWDFDGEYKDKQYNVTSSAYSIQFGGRYLFTKKLPAYVELDMGYIFFDGDLSVASGINKSESVQDLADRLSSGFGISGPFVGIKFGWAYTFENGFYVDNSIVGMGTSFKMSDHYSNSASDIENIVQDKVMGQFIWALVNIGVGKLF